MTHTKVNGMATPTNEDELDKIFNPTVLDDLGIPEWWSKQTKAALSAYIQQECDKRDRKTLETVASMTGGGSSAQEALDTIKFYTHNKLLVVKRRLTPPPSKEVGKITMTPRELIERDLWEEYCQFTGTNEWAVDEGLINSNESLVLPQEFVDKFFAK